MNSAKNVKNALRSEAGDGERPGRTPVGGANARMVNPGGDQLGPIKKTGSKENIKCVLKKNLKHIRITKILFISTLLSLFEPIRDEKLNYQILTTYSRYKLELKRLEELRSDLISRSYNPKVIHDAFQRVLQVPRELVLQKVQRAENTREVFSTKFHPSLP